jgi:plastocyanin
MMDAFSGTRNFNVTIGSSAFKHQNANVTGGEFAAGTRDPTVIISDFAFNPQDIFVTMGDTVTWTNNDSVIYTLWFVTAENQTTYMLSDPIAPNNSWSYTFSEPISLEYYSFDRLWITGSVTVSRGAGGGRVPYLN